MRAFLIWLAVATAIFGIAGAGTHFYLGANPTRVLVVLDSSFAMRERWPDARRRVLQLLERRYTEFAVATEKGVVHGWRARPDLRGLRPYAPRDFSRLASDGITALDDQASQTYLVTDAPDTVIPDLPGWTVLRPR